MYPRLGDVTIAPLTVPADYGQPSPDDSSTLIPGFTPDVTAVTPSSNGLDVGSLISTGLTDIVQFFHPGTPSPTPLYTPASSALSSPAALGVLALAAVLLLKGRR